MLINIGTNILLYEILIYISNVKVIIDENNIKLHSHEDV